MWLVIVIALSVGMGILALIGLVAVAKELLCDSVLDPDFTDAGSAAAQDDIGPASARRSVMTR